MTVCLKESVQSPYILGSPKDEIMMACYIRFILIMKYTMVI